MNEPKHEPDPLRAFVRGTWRLLLVQLAVAILVFGALTFASIQLKGILDETATKQRQLLEVREQKAMLDRELETARQGLENTRKATPIVRDAIINFHNRHFEEAIGQYQMALGLDPGNSWVRDLLGYAQYMAGRAARDTGQPELSARRFDDAVASVRQVLQEVPDYIGGYVELAIYECARAEPDAAVEAYDAAVARSGDASREFISRVGEIPQRCVSLRRRLTAP